MKNILTHSSFTRYFIIFIFLSNTNYIFTMEQNDPNNPSLQAATEEIRRILSRQEQPPPLLIPTPIRQTPPSPNPEEDLEEEEKEEEIDATLDKMIKEVVSNFLHQGKIPPEILSLFRSK